jgi:hypothetical protein
VLRKIQSNHSGASPNLKEYSNEPSKVVDVKHQRVHASANKQCPMEHIPSSGNRVPFPTFSILQQKSKEQPCAMIQKKA